MVSYPSINLVDLIIDEVALEGLDGITLQALWLRLAQGLNNSFPLPKPLMIQIWSICIEIREFEFYELKTAREPLVIYDRYEFVDPDLGIILEPDNVPPDIYPHCPINDVPKGIKGSCSTYYTRKLITENIRMLSLDEVTEKYGNKLVIVASQTERNHALMGGEVSPMIDLNVIQYCFLERVGRSRYHGEVTQGKLSLNALREDPKSLFYHRKLLLRHKLITKQIHHQKSGGHSCNGSLLHLTRFFVERKPKAIFLAEEVIKILQSKPNCVAEYDEIKRKLRIENPIRKLFKTTFFQKIVKTDIRVPYRTLYPNAQPTEWQQKNNPSKEKKIKVVQLLQPTIDVVEAWKDDIQEEDELHELNISNHKYCVPYLKQANDIIESTGSNGLCQGELGKMMGLTKLQSRTILRNLVKQNIVATYMNDIGRQRLTKYVSKRFEKGSMLSKQFNIEMHKIKELTKQMTENDDSNKSVSMKQEKEEPAIDEKEKKAVEVSECVTISENNENICLETTEEPTTSQSVIQETFYVVNRILYKYRITKRANKYKRTFLNYKNNIQAKEEKTDSNVLSEITDLSKNEKAVAAYKNIKVDLTILSSLKARKSENEGFMENVQHSEKKSSKHLPHITYRLLRRANMIIESVKEHQVIDDMTKLMKMIHEEEDKEGYDVKIDKKSLIRLLQKLAKDNVVKNIKITLSGNGKEKTLIFICDPNIDTESTVIQSAVEQAKLKFYLLLSHKTKSPAKKYTEKAECIKSNNSKDVLNKPEDKPLLKQFKALSENYRCGPRGSKKYGYSPKFIRMQALHTVLFYLVYEHPGEPRTSRKEQVQALRNNGFSITDELAEEFTTIYTTDVNWKMFIPPLPKYTGWPEGWTLMCDVLLRLPLSIFVKLHFVSFVIPELDEYINHPIRKHYLVRELPPEVRNSLLYARKYIFNIHETMTRLCYIGLIQFGPQKLKEKDQVFIYVNRRTELMDTTSSAPGYHIIEDKSYPIYKYSFDELSVVEKYWYDMWNTCISTPLGGRLVVQGKDIVLEDLNKKTAMIQAAVARSPEEAVKLDTGQVPGDHKGAAGIDSACFAHLKRNWNWGISNNTQQTKKQQNVEYERDTYLSKIKAKPLKFTEFSGLKRVSGPPSVNATELRKKVQTKTDGNTNQQKKYEALTCCRNAKQKSYVRRVLPRKCSNRKRTKYDEIDYRALQRMHKLRVDWDPYEDKILLICKVAMVYLCPNPRKQVITFSMVRDVLRTYSHISYNKTSRACQRRLLYMLRQQQNVNIVALGVEEIKQNFFIRTRFDNIMDRLKEEHKNFYEFDTQVAEVFKSLVSYIIKKYYDISDVEAKDPLPMPATAQEFNVFYKVVHPTKPFGNRGFTKDVRNINDINSAVINSVIHSSMCCGKDRRSWAYQLFKVYQQYPEMLLRNAMAKIRSDQLVTVKKSQLPTIRKYGNYMPMSSSQYQLSSNYIYKFHTKWPYDIFKESYDVFFKLSNWYHQIQLNKENDMLENSIGVEVSPVTGGVIAAIHDYITRDQIDFDIEVPDQVIMLDPRLQEKDETYFRIAKRYQDVLASLDNLKYIKESSSQNSGVITNLGQNKERYMDAEKNLLSQEYDVEERNFEDAKSFADYDDLNFNSDDENSCNAADDNTIKFQDGTKIVLNKEDIERSTACDEDAAMEIEEDNNLKLPNEEQLLHYNEGNSVTNMENLVPSHLSSKSKTDIQKQIITCGNKRCSNKDESDVDEPKKKRLKSDDEVVNCETKTKKDVSELPNNDNISIKLSDQIQNNDSNKTSIHEVDNYNGMKQITDSTNPSEQTALNIKNEITIPLRKINEQTFTRVSDILKSVPSEQCYLHQYCKIDDSGDMHKRYTRLALLRMREELSELTVADSHHAHEYFVVNMFKVFYSLNAPNSQGSIAYEIFRNFPIPSELLPLKLEAASSLIRELNEYAVFPKDGISYSDLKKNLSEEFPLCLSDIEAVYKFVRDKKELGATIPELTDQFINTLGENLFHILSFLVKHHLFLRSGVTTVRCIHHRYADSWLIHSYKICRLEKESLVPLPKKTVYVTEPEIIITEGGNDVNTIEKSNENPSVSSEKVTPNTAGGNLECSTQSEIKNQENEDSDKELSDHSDEEYNTQVKKRMQRKRTGLLPQRDISRAVKQLDLTTKEEIRVAIKPWIRIDGVLNRRVLDRMLGAVLSYCLTHPGIALTKVQTRFLPALQPCHTRELVEILVKLECLERIILKKPRVTLFSKPSPIEPKTVNNDWNTEEEIFLEPATGAMLKFGIFLSTKMYNSDYIK
ncbi:general transcription factor 3C polypeptide 1 isoform X2 [Nomia melanderi]|uniref:general transcription factor 3C polypeptide 1 isoform X2 n=1 Tax=Nomia melanderi TaxID=2448451 RepID=UPI0013042DC7|nr:general transcription factor 3C polypeptide 1 isoform X2 [Nomia melanderi]